VVLRWDPLEISKFGAHPLSIVEGVCHKCTSPGRRDPAGAFAYKKLRR